jgi:hypothetical protein
MKKGRMDSIDIGHVPPPDPENFWDLVPGQHRTLIKDHATLKLLTIQQEGYDDARAEVALFIGGHTVIDWLNQDRPCVALRLVNGEPYVTLTLRKVTYDDTPRGLPIVKAYLQVTVNPKAPQGKSTNA